MRHNILSCLVLTPEIVMHDAFNVMYEHHCRPNSDLRQFGTSAEVSPLHKMLRHFGTSAEVSVGHFGPFINVETVRH